MPSSDNKAQEEGKPFGSLWIDSCYQQTLLPNAPWGRIEEHLSKTLASLVEKQFVHPERKQMILQLLGDDFVEKYLPDERRNPSLLENPNMGVAEKERLEIEAKSWLNRQIIRAARDVGYDILADGVSDKEHIPSELVEFLQHSFSIYQKGLDRQLFKQEKELMAEKEKEIALGIKHTSKRQFARIPAPSGTRNIHSSASSYSEMSENMPSKGKLQEMVHKLDGDPPPLWGAQSDLVGKSVVSVLERDPRKIDQVTARLKGRQLPGTLRSYIWADVLFKPERKRLKEANVEKVTRERFAKTVHRGTGELKIKRATQSPINGVIENAVIETYRKTPSMLDMQHDDHLKEASRSLNVLYVYDRSYEPYLIHWLFPLQIAFQPSSGHTTDLGEHVYELAMYLDLLNSHCFPTWPQVYAIADRVLAALKKGDSELHGHMEMIALINPKVNPKEFLVQVLRQEMAQAESGGDPLLSARKGGAADDQILIDPLVFIRRWIGEGFVSVLDTPAVMFVWDQLFMQGWKHSLIENFCIVIIELLRHRFLEARNYTDLKEVFLNQPSKLYTRDIQTGCIDFENGKHITEIQYLNRQRPSSPSSRLSLRSALSTPGVTSLLQSCGITNIHLKLVVPQESARRNPWLENVNKTNLKLQVGVFFGSIRLKYQTSQAASKLERTDKDKYGTVTHIISYPRDKFLFENLDLSQYDVEKELGAYPYAIVSVQCFQHPANKGRAPITIGWARVPLFKRDDRGGRDSTTSFDASVWNLLSGDYTFTLHAGDVPDTLAATHPVTPSVKEEDNIIGYGSELMSTIYDPRSKTPVDMLPIITDAPQISQIPPTDTRDIRPPPSYRERTPQAPPKDPTPVPMNNPSPSPQPSPPTYDPDAQPSPLLKPAEPTRTPTQEDNSSWVPYKTSTAKSNPTPTSHTEPFDMYIDGVRFIPDNATIIKVTGRALRAGQVSNIPDILVTPDLTSPARSPLCHFRLQFIKDNKKMDPNLLILLRVYTVDIVTEKIVVIGSCLFNVFDVTARTGKLRVGAFQMRLRCGLPDMSRGMDSLKPSAMDNITPVPSASILVRLLPHGPGFSPARSYSSGCYESESCKPSESEWRIFEGYNESMAYPKTVKDMIKRLQDHEGVRAGSTDGELSDWLLDRLDTKKRLPNNEPAPSIPLTRCVRYKVKTGLFVNLNQASGLPDGLYIQSFMNVLVGKKVAGMDPSPEGYGRVDGYVTKVHDFSSFQQSPKWRDTAQLIRPFYDQNTCLLVLLFGVGITYRPNPDHNTAGAIYLSDGDKLTLTDKNIIGWGIVPLFEGNSTHTGVHQVPIFKGKPNSDMLNELSVESAENVLGKRSFTSANIYTTGSLSVTLWDGHFDYADIPDLPHYDYLLRETGNMDAVRKTGQQKGGKRISDFIVGSLEPAYKKQGTNSQVYSNEKKFFEESILNQFPSLMDSVLKNEGFK